MALKGVERRREVVKSLVRDPGAVADREPVAGDG
jgi:hypothetical protein